MNGDKLFNQADAADMAGVGPTTFFNAFHRTNRAQLKAEEERNGYNMDDITAVINLLNQEAEVKREEKRRDDLIKRERADSILEKIRVQEARERAELIQKKNKDINKSERLLRGEDIPSNIERNGYTPKDPQLWYFALYDTYLGGYVVKRAGLDINSALDLFEEYEALGIKSLIRPHLKYRRR